MAGLSFEFSREQSLKNAVAFSSKRRWDFVLDFMWKGGGIFLLTTACLKSEKLHPSLFTILLSSWRDM